MMKIASWNVNGLQSIINKKGSLDNVLSSLDADVVCLQELRTSNVPFLKSWVSFHSSPEAGVKSRSGVATLVRSGHRIPTLIGEGHTSAKTLLARHSLRRGWSHHGDKEDPNIDSKGRCLVTDHKDFVLFNVYIPAGQPSNLDKFAAKLSFCKALERRVQHFMRAGRRVIIAGDFNISPDPMDDLGIRGGFVKGDRLWLRSFLHQTTFGLFKDSFRDCHPEKRSYSILYTPPSEDTWTTAYPSTSRQYNWSWSRQQASSSSSWERQAFGSRLDLIIVGTPGLPVCCTGADVLDKVSGSDHFPVWAMFQFTAVDPAPQPASTRSSLSNVFPHLPGEQGPVAPASKTTGHPSPPPLLFQLLLQTPLPTNSQHAQMHNTTATKHDSASQPVKRTSPSQPTKKVALTQRTLNTWIAKGSGSQMRESTTEPQMTQKRGPESPASAAEIQPQVGAHDQGNLESAGMLESATAVPWAETKTMRTAAAVLQTEAAVLWLQGQPATEREVRLEVAACSSDMHTRPLIQSETPGVVDQDSHNDTRDSMLYSTALVSKSKTPMLPPVVTKMPVLTSELEAGHARVNELEVDRVMTESVRSNTAVQVGSGQLSAVGSCAVQVRSGQSSAVGNPALQVMVEDPAGRNGQRVGVLRKQPTKRVGRKRGPYKNTRAAQLRLAKALACKAPEQPKPKRKSGDATPKPTQVLADFLERREQGRLPPALGATISAVPSSQPTTAAPDSLTLTRASTSRIPRAASSTEIRACACMYAPAPPVRAAVNEMSQMLEEWLEVPRCAGLFKCQHEGPSQGREYYRCLYGDCCAYVAWVGFRQQGLEASRSRLPAFLL